MRAPLVGRDRGVVRARGTDFLYDRIDGDRGILRTQPPDLVVDLSSLDRAAAGAVDAQHDALRALVLERGLQALHDVLGARRPVGVELAAQLDLRGALVDARALALGDRDNHREQPHEQKPEGQQLEEDAPAAGTRLLAQPVGGELLDDPAFPAFLGHVQSSLQ